MRRWGITALAVLAGAIFVAACGGSDDAGSDAKRADGARDLFALAAAEISSSDTSMFLRADDDHVDAVERVVRATTGGRVVLNELPRRGALVRRALRALGFDAPTATALTPLVRRDVVVSRSVGGWMLWVSVARDRRAAAERIVDANRGRASLRSGVLRIATMDATWGARDAASATKLADVDRWQRLAESSAGKQAVVLGVDKGRIIAVAADDDGLRARGQAGAAVTCDGKPDAVRALAEEAPSGVRVAAAGSGPRNTGRDALGDALDLSTTTLRRVAAIDLGSGRVDRIRDAMVAGAAALRLGAASIPTSNTGDVVALTDAGATRPGRAAPVEDGDPSLADDPNFDRTMELADAPDARRAWWVDLDGTIRAAADADLSGIERSVARTLGTGIDGMLAWQTCDGRFGALLAVEG